jgi:hypothetical protein
MKAWMVLLMLASVLVCRPCLWSQEPAAAATAPAPPAQPAQSEKVAPAKHPILMYIPNRLFDALDIIRARVRVGPGLSVGVHATAIADVFIGAHDTAYIGLPGPRGRAQIPRLVGYDVRPNTGTPATDNAEHAPYFDPAEIEAEAQALIVGPSVGVALMEVVDFVGGFFCIDIKNDDF